MESFEKVQPFVELNMWQGKCFGESQSRSSLKVEVNFHSYERVASQPCIVSLH
jgi:hypothetical protein